MLFDVKVASPPGSINSVPGVPIDGDVDGLVDGDELTEDEGDGEDEGDVLGDVLGLVDGLLDTDEEGDDEGDELTEEEGDGELEGLLDTEEEGDVLGEVDGELLGLGELEAEVEGDDEAEEPAAVKVSHDIAPSSLLVPPVQVRVAVPAVVDVAVVNPKFPTSTSKSSVAFAHVARTVSVAFAAIAINPPPAAIVCDPVVSGAVASMSVEPLPPDVGEIPPPVTAYTAM